MFVWGNITFYLKRRRFGWGEDKIENLLDRNFVRNVLNEYPLHLLPRREFEWREIETSKSVGQSVGLRDYLFTSSVL